MNHRITLVAAPGCHLCRNAEAVLEELATEFPLEVTAVDAATAEGRSLIAAHRVAMQPLVLLDDEFFSAGRLPRSKLRRTLERVVP